MPNLEIKFKKAQHWNNYILIKGKTEYLIRFNRKLSISNQKLPKYIFKDFVVYF